MKLATLHEFKVIKSGYNRSILYYADRTRRYFIDEYGSLENNRYIAGVILDDVVLYEEAYSFVAAIRALDSYCFEEEL